MSKQSLVEQAARAAADFGTAADAVDEAAAAVLGVNRTDLRILGALQSAPLTAGQLATAVQLSPAAATTAIQRLAARGHLTRQTDPSDRRRAVVDLTAPTRRLVDRVYGPIAAAGAVELERYTAAELEVITDFLERGRLLQLAEADRIRELAGQVFP